MVPFVSTVITLMLEFSFGKVISLRINDLHKFRLKWSAVTSKDSFLLSITILLFFFFFWKTHLKDFYKFLAFFPIDFLFFFQV